MKLVKESPNLQDYAYAMQALLTRIALAESNGGIETARGLRRLTHKAKSLANAGQMQAAYAALIQA